MEPDSILLGVLLVVAIVACGVGVWALFEGAKTARALRVLAQDVDARIVPLLEKADVTIDAVNAELLRVDTIVSRMDEITDRVESTTRTVQGVANAPGEIVNDIAERVRKAWRRHQAEAAVSQEARRAEAESAQEPSGPEAEADEGDASPV